MVARGGVSLYITELHKLYTLAQILVTKDEYNVLQMSLHKNEIWLEKYDKRKTTIIRMIHQGFNWKNELQSDMNNTLARFQTIQQAIVGKEVELHNVYISAYPPVDTWEMLKRPMHVTKKKSIHMHMYYIDEVDCHNELIRLSEMLDRGETFHIPSVSVEEQEYVVDTYKHTLANEVKQQKEKVQNILFYGKPKLVYYFIALNVLYFIFIEFNGGSMDTETLITYGAKYNPAIIDGEWWRIVTSMFMHIGIIHLGMNMLALYYLGTAVEQIFGLTRFMVMYMLAGIGAGIASFALTNSVSAGASGAIFGMFGALLYFGVIHRKLFLQTMGTSILFIIGINLVFGFTVPAIDNSAHIGGLIAGLVAANIVQLPKQQNKTVRKIGTVVFVIGISVCIWYGFTNNSNVLMYELTEIEQLQEEKEYDVVIERTTELLESDDQFAPQLLFQRSYARIMTFEFDTALEDLEQLIVLEDTRMPEAYYNAALLYIEKGETDLAKERIKQAYELQPENEDVEEVYKQLWDDE